MAKKSFLENPALQFLSSADEPKDSPVVPVSPRSQIKSRRVQLIMQPDLYDRIKQKSSEAGLSVNDFCHRILDQATR